MIVGLVVSTVLCAKLHLPPATPYRHTIESVSCRHHVDPRLTAAVIATESLFDRWAVVRERDGDTSRGLMQIELRTARMLGFRKNPRQLFGPWLNIFYGTLYLERELKRYHSFSAAISAYNAGHPARTRSGSYVNAAYIHRVGTRYWRLRGRKPHRVLTPRLLARRWIPGTLFARLDLRER